MDDLRVLDCQNLVLRIQCRYATPFRNFLKINNCYLRK
jgi:hypothetical protein